MTQLLKFLSGNLLASRKDYWFFPKNSALNLGTYFFFFYKDTFIYHINLEGLKKQNLVAFFCVFLKIWLCKEAKISKKSVPIGCTSKLTVLFGGVKYIF
jgi:hypothetical protein